MSWDLLWRVFVLFPTRYWLLRMVNVLNNQTINRLEIYSIIRDTPRLEKFPHCRRVVILFHYRRWTDIGTCQWQHTDTAKTDHQQPKTHIHNILITIQLSCGLHSPRGKINTEYFHNEIFAEIQPSRLTRTYEDGPRFMILHYNNAKLYMAECINADLVVNQTTRTLHPALSSNPVPLELISLENLKSFWRDLRLKVMINFFTIW
jgi:hypothetical protein